MQSPELIPVILCGGSGTRLWPLSRESYPKQFLALYGDGRTMLQHTAVRLKGMSAQVPVSNRPIVVCNAEHRFLTAQQLSELGLERPRILLEPAGRNTAPALTLAALLAAEQSQLDHDPVLMVMPADHVIGDEAAFCQAAGEAWKAATKGAMVTFGVVADRPETGYGYIQHGEAADDGIHAIRSFAEKPDRPTAERYLAEGGYSWNSGLFVVRARVWLSAMERFRPDILSACRKAMSHAQADLDFVRPDSAAFNACPSESIDYAVMERLPADTACGIPARVVPLQAGWSDVGAWDALWKVLDHDDNGNAALGETISVESSNSLLVSNGRLVVGIGLADVVVVETPDAVLVTGKAHTQTVKQVVTELKARGQTLADSHRKVHRPWGWYDSIDTGERFQVKRIVVNPGASLSMQMHHHRAEHWVVVRGTAEVTNGEKIMLLSENESTFIPIGHVHRLSNPGKVPLELIEVQSGSYLGEDDIVRFEDTYGRAERAAT